MIREELDERIDRFGLRVVRFHGDYLGGEYDEATSPAIIAILEGRVDP